MGRRGLGLTQTCQEPRAQAGSRSTHCLGVCKAHHPEGAPDTPAPARPPMGE